MIFQINAVTKGGSAIPISHLVPLLGRTQYHGSTIFLKSWDSRCVESKRKDSNQKFATTVDAMLVNAVGKVMRHMT